MLHSDTSEIAMHFHTIPWALTLIIEQYTPEVMPLSTTLEKRNAHAARKWSRSYYHVTGSEELADK